MKTEEGSDVMLSYPQAAELLGLKVATLYAMVSQRRVPHVRMGSRLVRFSRRALLAWVAAHAVSACAPGAQ